MNNYIEVNLEEDYPTVKEALKLADDEIERYRKFTKVIVFIHGYGSSGVGGKIQSSLRTHLETLKKNGKIKNYFPGERFNFYNNLAIELNNKYKIIKYYCKDNNGVTLVEL